MARFCSAAHNADASPAPETAPRLRSLALLILVVVAGCSSAAARDEPSNRGIGKAPSSTAGGSGSRPPGTVADRKGGSHPVVGSGRADQKAVVAVWTRSKTAFYEAALHDEPDYPALLDTLVTSGAVYAHSIAYLSALAAEGLVGPGTWRVGNARVVHMTRTRAEVQGCLWDSGSVWKASGSPAPAALGGGSGYTASDALMVLEHGRWLILEDSVSAVKSNKEPGPCHGFSAVAVSSSRSSSPS